MHAHLQMQFVRVALSLAPFSAFSRVLHVPFSIFAGRWSYAQLSLKWQDQRESPSGPA